MPLIRDTIDPTREREVTREEALDLERMGGLLDMSATRARTDDGLRAAAVRQIAERLGGDPSDDPGPTVTVGVGDPQPSGDEAGGDDEPQDPGVDPVSTTDDTPTDSPQED